MNTTLIGQTLLDQYRVEAFVASGGMGAVYRVFDLKRNVPMAMKVLHADLAQDASVFKRFQREARALQKLTHPNILPFYGVHQSEGLTFLLVRYIDGMTLKDIQRSREHRPMSVSEALPYLKALCAALGYAHAHSVVHCDVKPGNVMVERGGTIYLTDFGIARHADSTATTLASLGTAAYMAPEQIRGEAVTPATDIYALGVLLFELLVGLRPFRGDKSANTDNDQDSANEHVRYLHLNATPPDPVTLNPQVPPAVAQVVLKALSKAPEERYISTHDLLNAACQAVGVPVEEVPDVAGPVVEQLQRHTPASTTQPSDPMPPNESQPVEGLIGRYKVLREIGRGGMATVYAAHDPVFNRDVAIKMLPPELLFDPSFRARFEREARTVAALEHPAIVPVYDYGEAQGRPYFVMRLMSGGSLAERIAQKPQSLDTSAKLLERIAKALDEAHSRGIIHRDLKPGNILFDQYDEPYLTDFGIAKLKEGGATLTGENIVGTPAYMSPEQGRGEADLDERSDVYSLGCILFEMLTGKAPFESSTPMGQVVKHLTAPIPNICEHRPDLPPATQEIINRAMAKRKFSRYSKASSLSQALTNLAEGKELPIPTADYSPVHAPPVVPVQKPPSGPTPPGGQKPPSGPVPRPSTTPLSPPKKKSLAWLVWVMVALVLAGGVYAGLNYLPGIIKQNLALPPATTQPASAPGSLTDTPEPPQATETPPPASPTPQPTETEAPTALPSDTAPAEVSPEPEVHPLLLSTGPVIGGADKIAFVKNNDIWMANLDATEIIQLTFTGGYKSELQWTPDRAHIKFIMGKCALLVDIRDLSVQPILCANWAAYLASFEISPDGQQVAITTSDGLFVLPYNLEELSRIKRQDQLLGAPGCLKFTERQIKTVRWSADGKMLATVIVGSELGRSVDLIWVTAFTCGQRPVQVDQFPGARFTMVGYAQSPVIESFGWDGDVNFALNVDIRIGYGDLYTYNINNNQSAKINPLDNGRCCYRDFNWSPDGQYFLFTYLDSNTMQNIRLYFINYGLLGQGQSYAPLPFAEDFFPANQNVAPPQPVLRPAP